jgi:hypothetical protein
VLGGLDVQYLVNKKFLSVGICVQKFGASQGPLYLEHG